MANHSSEHNLLFKASTPLGFSVHVTHSCWKLIVTVKHPVMAKQESEVQDTLENPDEIRLSRRDPTVDLFYISVHIKRWICAVVKRLNGEGFLITSYPTDAIKEGAQAWLK